MIVTMLPMVQGTTQVFETPHWPETIANRYTLTSATHSTLCGLSSQAEGKTKKVATRAGADHQLFNPESTEVCV